MARIDYLAIEDAIARTLRENLFEVTVTVEEELTLSLDMSPQVLIFLMRRDLSENQYLSAGRRVDYDLQIALWCWCFGLESRAAVSARNELVSEVERVLLGNRHFGMDPDVVETTMINGGEMPSGRVPDVNGFGSGGEILLTVKVHATSEG